MTREVRRGVWGDRERFCWTRGLGWLDGIEEEGEGVVSGGRGLAGLGEESAPEGGEKGALGGRYMHVCRLGRALWAHIRRLGTHTARFKGSYARQGHALG